MDNFKYILEAVNRGIKLALDNFDNNVPIALSISKVKSKDLTSEWLDILDLFVDLGLPSGTLWAKYNLGVDIDKIEKTYLEKQKVADKFKELYGTEPKSFLELNKKPEDWYGNYYAWGETEPKKTYNWLNYKFGTLFSLTKYCYDHSYGLGLNIDNLKLLLPEDDAAYLYDHRFKIPTNEQFNELIANTTNRWIKNYQNINGLNGRLFRSRINGNELFIPASGYKDFPSANKPIYAGETGYLYSANTGTFRDADKVLTFVFDAYTDPDLYGLSRCAGVPIRPVLNLN